MSFDSNNPPVLNHPRATRKSVLPNPVLTKQQVNHYRKVIDQVAEEIWVRGGNRPEFRKIQVAYDTAK